MTTESAFISALRALATHPAARGLSDDAAVLAVGGATLVLTHDMIVEGVHFLPDDPAGDVAWKLVAVNLSDLAAKGAEPLAALMSVTIAGDGTWEESFLAGVAAACEAYRLPLVGGDTIALPVDAPRVLGLTAIGRGGAYVPSRAGGQPGDRLWLVGTLGDAAAGLAVTVPRWLDPLIAPAAEVPPFTQPLRVPPVLTGADITLPIAAADVPVVPGAPTRMWTFGGSFPGPTIRRPTGTTTTGDSLAAAVASRAGSSDQTISP